jgi:tripartite-type tricarboxylate transporter receptor subunit TctC
MALMKLLAGGVLALALELGALSTAATEPVADFYRGKVIHLIIGGSTGSGYDLVGRLLASHMPRHIPGQPSMIVENMPGAASLIMSNHLYNRAVKDGTVMGIPNSNMPLEPRLKLLSRAGGQVRFAIDRFNWIGTPVQEPQIFWTSTTGKFQKFDDLRISTFIAGATSLGADHHILPTFMNELLGTQIKIVTGYAGPRAFFIVTESGELDGAISALSEIFGRPNLRVLVQFGTARHSTLPDVPTAIELAMTDDARKLLAFYALKYQMARPVIMPPEVPKERVEALRRAFDATMKDRAFIADAGKLGFDIDPINGEQITKLIQQIEDTPQSIVDRVRKMIDPSSVN